MSTQQQPKNQNLVAPAGPPEIEPHEVRQSNQAPLGNGTFGKVVRGKCRGKEVAIKILHKPINDEKQLAIFKGEVAALSSLYHPNICLFMGACTKAGHNFIVQEFMPGGDVEQLLAKCRKGETDISLCKRMVMAKDAALGMNWLHCSKPTFIHRDLKSSNLLLDEKLRVKVCDFGLSQVIQRGEMLQDNLSAKGTPLWMAPEVMQFQAFNEKADVYSFGIVLWEFLTKEPPFAHHSNYTVFKKAVCKDGERPPIPADCEPSLKALIEQCWAADPEQRPSFEEIIPRLERIIVDVAIHDTLGRQFWKSNFLGQEEVPWKNFARRLDSFIDLPDDDDLSQEDANRINHNFKILKQVLTPNVTLEHFGALLEWVGPITEPSTTPIDHTILDNLRELLEQSWFHGNLEVAMVHERLNKQPPGTFLVRFSSVPGCFTISHIKEDGQVRHIRIQHSLGSPYVIDNTPYASLSDLLRGKFGDYNKFICSKTLVRDGGYGSGYGAKQ